MKADQFIVKPPEITKFEFTSGFGVFDTEFTARFFSVSREGKRIPEAFLAEERQNFLKQFSAEGIAMGLIREDVMACQYAFYRGLFSIYKGPESVPANELFLLDRHLKTLDVLTSMDVSHIPGYGNWIKKIYTEIKSLLHAPPA